MNRSSTHQHCRWNGNQTAQRRDFIKRSAGLGLGGLVCVGSAGCVPQNSKLGRMPDLVWGRRGLSEGRLMKPRALTVSPTDEIYIVDLTGRIQVFDREGNYLRGWRTPEIKQGKPTGLGWSRDNRLIVADTHYFRVLFYTPEGQLEEARTIGGEHGDEPGQFHFVTDALEAANGHFFVGQYGQIDRIQEFYPDGTLRRIWGSQGSQPGEFSRPQCLLLDDGQLLWVADACNHRLQIFDLSGDEPQLVDIWGTPGSEVGQLQYPYGVVFDTDGTLLIAEYGNHRIQRFSRNGEPLEVFGQSGTEVGEFNSPWGLVLDSKRNLHVLDTLNHRVQRYSLA